MPDLITDILGMLALLFLIALPSLLFQVAVANWQRIIIFIKLALMASLALFIAVSTLFTVFEFGLFAGFYWFLVLSTPTALIFKALNKPTGDYPCLV